MVSHGRGEPCRRIARRRAERRGARSGCAPAVGGGSSGGAGGGGRSLGPRIMYLGDSSMSCQNFSFFFFCFFSSISPPKLLTLRWSPDPYHSPANNSIYLLYNSHFMRHNATYTAMNMHRELRGDMNVFGKMPPSLPVPFLS